MSSSIKISLKSPCPENWQIMSPTEKGAFCQKCSIEVVDFTRMSDEEVFDYFKQKPRTNPGPTSCGRFTNQQVNRTLNPGHKSSPGWKRIATTLGMIILPAFVFTKKLFAQSDHAQSGTNNPPKFNENESGKPGRQLKSVPENPPYYGNEVFFGYVNNEENNQPLIGVRINIFKNEKIVSVGNTDSLGFFKFTSAEIDFEANSKYFIRYTADDYESIHREIMLLRNKKQYDLSTTLGEKIYFLMGDIIIIESEIEDNTFVPKD